LGKRSIIYINQIPGGDKTSLTFVSDSCQWRSSVTGV
jgi:hypothetical protein